MSGKKLLSKPKLPKVSTYVFARFRTWKLARSTYCLSCGSRKAFCEVYNSAII